MMSRRKQKSRKASRSRLAYHKSSVGSLISDLLAATLQRTSNCTNLLFSTTVLYSDKAWSTGVKVHILCHRRMIGSYPAKRPLSASHIIVVWPIEFPITFLDFCQCILGPHCRYCYIVIYSFVSTWSFEYKASIYTDLFILYGPEDILQYSACKLWKHSHKAIVNDNQAANHNLVL